MTRYIVVPGSVSAHCCFDASVLDTAITHDYADANDEPRDKHPQICECFNMDEAHHVALALNALEDQPSIPLTTKDHP